MRKNRHTNLLVNSVIDNIKAALPDATAEIIYPVDKNIEPCRVTCNKFCSENSYKCITADGAAETIEAMIKADAVVIGTPLYFRSAPSKFYTLVEKIIAIFLNYEAGGKAAVESPLKNKPCGLAGVAEYSNPHQMLEYLHDFCTLLNMNPVRISIFRLAAYWYPASVSLVLDKNIGSLPI
jgi:multimeric flavodoxin WrbA